MTDPHAEARRIAELLSAGLAHMRDGQAAKGERLIRAAFEQQSAREERQREAINNAEYALHPNQGEPGDPSRASQWLRSTFPPGHPNYVSPAVLSTPAADAEARAEHLREAREVEAWQEAKHARREEGR